MRKKTLTGTKKSVATRRGTGVRTGSLGTESQPKSTNQGFPSYCSMPIVKSKVMPGTLNPGRLELIVSVEKKWLNGTTLHYYFFDKQTDGRVVMSTNGTQTFRRWATTEAEKNIVRKAFETWKRVGIGLKFEEVSSRDEAEIRIGFERGDGAWSFVGRDILGNGMGVNDRTMNFGWDLVADPDGLDTAIHEIGHTVGFPHEHQNPFAGIVWDEEAVYDALAAPPNNWDRDKTFWNIIRKIEPDEVQGSNWDPDSVMHYPFGPGLIKKPENLALSGIQPAGGLSTRDKAWIKTFYPPIAGEQLHRLKVAESVKLALAAGQQKNFEIAPTATRVYDFKTFGQSDIVMAIFEKEGAKMRYIAGEDDLGEDRNGALRLKLFSGRKYVLRVRLAYADRSQETALMMW